MVPTLQDGSLYLSESTAILRYLSDNHSSDHSLYPTDPKERAVIDMHLGVGADILIAEGLGVYFKIMHPIGMIPETALAKNNVKECDQIIAKLLPVINTYLETHAYLCGDKLTLVDFKTYPALLAIQSWEIAEYSAYPKVVEYLKTLPEKHAAFKTLLDSYSAVKKPTMEMVH
jgi:glutathione S-transferase